MSVGPVFVRDRKSTNRLLQLPALGVNDPMLEIDRFRYFKASVAITVGQWVSLALGDARSVLPSLDSIGTNMGVGIAVEAATSGEATAGKIIKVQVAGVHPAASVATNGSATGWWACLSATSGRCDPIDPTTGTALNLSLRMGICLEASAGGLCSVLIIPRFV
jgi:hypothetical protein